MSAVPILIVDPTRERHWPYHEWLSRAFALEIVESGEAALLALGQRRVALVILVAELPDIPGVALCARIRETPGGRGAKILLAGEDLNDAILGRDTARQMGADDLIQLPYDPAHLKNKLKSLLLELKAERGTGSELSQPALPGEAPLHRAAAEAPAQSAGPGALLERLDRLDRELDSRDYYALLGVPAEANPAQIRRAYHALSRDFHPDRFVLVRDSARGEAAGRVFRRLAEAYRTLKDPGLRRDYDKTLEQGAGLRLKKTERTTQGPRDEAVQISHPQARKFYSLAAAAHAAGDLKTARMNLKLALSLLPGDPQITTRLAEIEKLL